MIIAEELANLPAGQPPVAKCFASLAA
jgi:hypothetical protein